jgi:hypothetical protein
VRLLAGSLFAFIIAAIIGLGATWLALTSNAHFGALTIGGWTAYPRSGTADADPYTRASIARTGLLAIGLGDGVSFTARYDDNDRPLDGRCTIAVSGITPAARFWTLTLYNADGNLVANSLNRYGFTSQEVLRRDDGSFAITIAPRASTGNWLPTGGVERYLLVLRLYDTPVGVATRAGREAPMPQITTKECP